MQANQQEEFWRGDFGEAYRDRNTLDKVPTRIARWVKVLGHARLPINSFLELGCNIGINLHALHSLFPQAKLAGVEVNKGAVEIVRKWGKADVYEESLLNFKPPQVFDLAFTTGVLIHIAPENLPAAYATLYNASSRYIFITEYYNPSPVEVKYRGHEGKLFKRDFAGEILDRYPDVRLVDYGFFYHRDILHKADNSNWFLMEKF